MAYLHATKAHWKNAFSSHHIFEYGEPNSNAIPEGVLIREDGELNSISIVGRKRNNIEISIYAKRYDALRLEVRYLNETIRDLAGVPTTQVGTRFINIINFLDVLSGHAADIISEVLSYMPPAFIQSPSTTNVVSLASYSRFLGALNQKAESPQVFDEIFQGLLIRGYIDIPSTIDVSEKYLRSLRRTLNRLEKNEFLSLTKHKNGRKGYWRYSLMPDYHYTCEAVGAVFPNLNQGEQ